jgi:hypothetical protein
MVTTTSKSAAYEAWEQFMKDSAGRWTVDPIHSGRNGGHLILFRGYENEPTSGVFVTVDGSVIRAGTYMGAIPHVGDAIFETLWSRNCTNRAQAMDVVRRHTGARI